MTNVAKKLIEVAMPIKEISAESVRDKSIRHGHISTLHLWWARRPLPVCRAVVFASLVPDPDDEHCPPQFRQAVEMLLGNQQGNPQGDPYKPYDDIPWTPVFDPMPDTPRNRLQMFIGKFTDDMQQALKHNKKMPDANNKLTDHSLCKWESKNNPVILERARKLLWVAFNAAQEAHRHKSAEELLAEFDTHWQAVQYAERALYDTPDRHQADESVRLKEEQLASALEGFLLRMPRVFDPFAGGGAIPLEAARLGCRAFGNDINPVAHIIQKGSVEFPQRFGKPVTYSKAECMRLYGEETWNALLSEQPALFFFEGGTPTHVRFPNRLSFDVEFYAKKMLAAAERDIGRFYPPDERGKKPIAYYWARVGTCANPSCRAEVPLLKGFYLANTDRKQVYLKPRIEGKIITFDIEKGTCKDKGWMDKSALRCPCCGAVTDAESIRLQVANNKIAERMLAVIHTTEQGDKGYRLPTSEEISVLDNVPNVERPNEKLPAALTGGSIMSWGYTEWGQMFSPRQLLALQTLVAKMNDLKAELKPHESEYAQAVVTYLGILVDRIAVVNTSFGRWHTTGEKLEHPYSKAAIPMMFDYPESNMFCGSTGSALNQLEWLTRYIESEGVSPFGAMFQNAASGDKAQFPDKSITAVVTDPPYYDAIAYADVSDFFYVWLKRTLGDVFMLNFATPQTPKSDECTALKHHHAGSVPKAKEHFERQLLNIFDAIEHQTSDIVSIMFAHQSTEAWTTLCNSILGARMNISGSWSIDTEMANRSLGLGGAAVLASSVTVSCRPSEREGVGEFRTVKRDIEQAVEREVRDLYALGFRGADLLTACFGQAVREFGQYEYVEKADGSAVGVAELLELTRESAFNALVKGFEGDDHTKFVVGWLQLYGFAESDFDDAAKFTRVGLSIDVQELFVADILVRASKGNRQTLAGYAARTAANAKLGEQANSFLIDRLHRAMLLYKQQSRVPLVRYIGAYAASAEDVFWRALVALAEVLPAGTDDAAQATGLLAIKDSLLREVSEARSHKATPQTESLFANP